VAANCPGRVLFTTVTKIAISSFVSECNFADVGAAYTTVFAQKFNPELRLIGFLQGSVNL
jgi:hypothetical protein